MIDIDVTVDIEPIEIDVAVDLAPSGASVHNQLTGRDAADAHPGSSISLEAVEWATVQAMAEAVDENEAIAVDGVTIIGAGTTADPYKVEQRIQFFPTEQINAFTITADMLYKVVKINSASPVNVTVANMVVGSGVRFHILGAGLPVFLEGASQSITGVDEDGKPLGTDRTDVLIERFENDGATEIYNVI